uniref:Cilia- and flagella-associated protein 300 n=1 Tax=Homalodisca liturata TaxID=320908 RepID=A0A1B6JYI8_9HEMI
MEQDLYTFIHLPDRTCKALEDKDVRDYLMKWGMKGNLVVQYYTFNQPFQTHRKEEFVQSFFTDTLVYTTLVYNQSVIGRKVCQVSFETIPCTILSMEFFDRLMDPGNGVIRSDKSIIQCAEEEVDGFYVEDNLRNVILNEGSEFYKLFSDSERKQFLWSIFTHLCLGGEWCQYEFSVEPYLMVAKLLYKDLVSVERVGGSSELVVRSVVLRVQTYDENGSPLVPRQRHSLQDCVYLVIDPFKRSVAVLSHSYGGTFCA